MRCLIILKGSDDVKKEDWIKDENLENYYIEINTFYKLYSTPELVSPGVERVGRSFSNLVFQRFYEALILRLGKGGLVVVNLGNDTIKNVEKLAKIHGYQVFYKVFDQSGEDISADSIIIDTYSDLLDWWDREEFILPVRSKDGILHISDIHSNVTLWRKIINDNRKNHKYLVCHGDYIDGPEEGGSYKMIEAIVGSNNPNWFWLEGNHELRLRRYLGWKMFGLGGSKVISDILFSLVPEDFLDTTGKEFEHLTFSGAQSLLVSLNKKLKTHIVLSDEKSIYICTHAGIRFIEQLNPKNIGSVIYGDHYVDKQDQEFSKLYQESSIISIHAHCKYMPFWNPKKYLKVLNIDPIDESEVVFLSNKKNRLNYVVKKSSNYSKCEKTSSRA